MSADLVSVIVPMYNCEDRILRCVNSILNQTYENIEVIVIDDGSTDKSLEVLSSGIRDSRLKIFHQENTGFLIQGIVVLRLHYLLISKAGLPL